MLAIFSAIALLLLILASSLLFPLSATEREKQKRPTETTSEDESPVPRRRAHTKVLHRSPFTLDTDEELTDDELYFFHEASCPANLRLSKEKKQLMQASYGEHNPSDSVKNVEITQHPPSPSSKFLTIFIIFLAISIIVAYFCQRRAKERDMYHKLKSLHHRIQEYVTNQSIMAEKMHDMEEKLNNQERKLSVGQTRLEGYVHAVQNLENTLEDTRGVLRKKEEEVECLKASLKTLENTLQGNNYEVTRLQTLTKDMKKAIDEKEAKAQALTSKLQQVMRNLSNAENEIQMLEKRIQREMFSKDVLMEHAEQLQRHAMRVTEKNRALERKMKDAEQKWRQVKSSDEILRLEKRLEESLSENTALKERTMKLDSERSQVQLELDRHKQSVVELQLRLEESLSDKVNLTRTACNLQKERDDARCRLWALREVLRKVYNQMKTLSVQNRLTKIEPDKVSFQEGVMHLEKYFDSLLVERKMIVNLLGSALSEEDQTDQGDESLNQTIQKLRENLDDCIDGNQDVMKELLQLEADLEDSAEHFENIKSTDDPNVSWSLPPTNDVVHQSKEFEAPVTSDDNVDNIIHATASTKLNRKADGTTIVKPRVQGEKKHSRRQQRSEEEKMRLDLQRTLKKDKISLTLSKKIDEPEAQQLPTGDFKSGIVSWLGFRNYFQKPSKVSMKEEVKSSKIDMTNCVVSDSNRKIKSTSDCKREMQDKIHREGASDIQMANGGSKKMQTKVSKRQQLRHTEDEFCELNIHSEGRNAWTKRNAPKSTKVKKWAPGSGMTNTSVNHDIVNVFVPSKLRRKTGEVRDEKSVRHKLNKAQMQLLHKAYDWNRDDQRRTSELQREMKDIQDKGDSGSANMPLFEFEDMEPSSNNQDDTEYRERTSKGSSTVATDTPKERKRGTSVKRLKSQKMTSPTPHNTKKAQCTGRTKY